MNIPVPMTKILIVEDDDKLSSLIQKYLQQQHYDVTVLREGTGAVDTILSQHPDLVILDLLLPGKDGLSICREVRPHFSGVLLMLTASEDDFDHVAGIELGADDFIVKPIQPRVLLARIRMLMRRHAAFSQAGGVELKLAPHSSDRMLSFGQLHLDRVKRIATLRTEAIALTASEFDLLWLLAHHPEEVLSREFICQTLRGFEYDGLDRTIDNKIGALRRKLGDNASLSTRIITVRGQGYLFVPDAWDEA